MEKHNKNYLISIGFKNIGEYTYMLGKLYINLRYSSQFISIGLDCQRSSLSGFIDRTASLKYCLKEEIKKLKISWINESETLLLAVKEANIE
jgi:hypothetical protein